jgi:hypothetical protein
MLDIRLLFTAISRRRQQSLKELATDEDMAYITFINKIGRDAEKMKISTLEYMMHTLNYSLCISVKDENGQVIHSMESDPNNPLLDPNVYKGRREHFAENMKKGILNEDGTRRGDIGGAFEDNHAPVNNKKYKRTNRGTAKK